MASLSMASFSLRLCPLRSASIGVPHGYVQLARLNQVGNSLSLSSTHCISGLHAVVPQKISTAAPPNSQRFQSLTVFAAKGYKMKTHKAPPPPPFSVGSQRFRVTGRGKIVRRRAGKQHLLAKKNTKRKLRLSKMHPVSKSDYDNVIGALPYLKVNRNAK
ncbi:PREDICTED: 50S ribosomal protein L35, chloroplastic [Tarenaya hassleriana]|uniref:50S ribosomal protein L35, chloroplastic n=1 Tax=Tarenaya hassleriana TaxID=28532 RepID=UPI00053C3E46|nr:PREDICTED: 50S ribosomal protein L35, chloroplastic [Tarenaya hassleriana]